MDNQRWKLENRSLAGAYFLSMLSGIVGISISSSLDDTFGVGTVLLLLMYSFAFSIPTVIACVYTLGMGRHKESEPKRVYLWVMLEILLVPMATVQVLFHDLTLNTFLFDDTQLGYVIILHSIVGAGSFGYLTRRGLSKLNDQD